MVIKLKNANKRVLIPTVLLVVVSTIIAGFWLQSKDTPPVQYSGPVDKIKVGLIGEYAAIIRIANDQGYFKENGLEVTIEEYPSGPPALADMLAGKLDMAAGADFAGVRNSFKGEDLRILTTLSKSETFFMIARKDHGISDEADLKGKKIGITQQTVGEFYLGQFLTFNRLALGDVNIVNLPQAELITALEAGRIDAAVLFEPNAYKVNAKLGQQAVRWSVQPSQNLYSILFTTDKHTRERPEAIKRFINAMVQSEKFIRDNDKKARDIIARQLKYDTEYMNYIWPKYTFETSLEQEMLLNMDDQASWLIENRLVDASKAPNYLRMVYFDGLQAVKPEGITIIR